MNSRDMGRSWWLDAVRDRALRVMRPFAAIGLAAAPLPARGAPMVVPMLPGGWHAAPPVAWADMNAARMTFARNEGFPDGTMTVDDGVAVSDMATFSDGTIEFDEKPLGYDDAGIVFRRDGSTGGEFVYLRGNPDCPAAIDCIQYAPITHGLMGWDIYPDHQGPAPIVSNGWNHLRIELAGSRMRVFVNQAAEPALVVPRLQGLERAGGIGFKGAAVYANLVIDAAPVALDGIRAEGVEPGAITDWQAHAPEPSAFGRAVAPADIPASGAWRAIAAEPNGLVDIGRAFGEPDGSAPEIGWLRTAIDAPAPERRVLRLGWKDQVTVFLNGAPIFAHDNPYHQVERRLSPGGRLAPDNALIPLALHAGRNVVVLAVGNAAPDGSGRMLATHYGWAAEAHLEPPAGRREGG